MAARIAKYRGYRVIGVDLVAERLEMARRYDVETIDLADSDDAPEAIRELTEGRGTDSVLEAVGMEAHGAPLGKLAQDATGFLPDAIARPLIERAAIDRMTALLDSFDACRRGGTVSISGVYGGQLDPMPMMDLFDKGLTLRMGQAHVRRWTDDLLPLVSDDADPLGTEDFATHRLPLDEAPAAYETFQAKRDGAVKILMEPHGPSAARSRGDAKATIAS
jgi:threonine dehydrogenase-like Zn-dependent dehydrogenase